MSSPRITQILSRFDALRTNRGTWEIHWQELAEVLLPNRADFIRDRFAGERRMAEIFDGVPMLARRELATAIHSLLKDKQSKWLFIEPADNSLKNDEDVRRWAEDTEDRMLSGIYARKAHFIQRTGEVDNDLVTFGTGALFIGENRNKDGLLFRAHHLKDTWIAENSDGEIDTIYLRRMLTPRQAAQRWGKENLGEKVKQALNDNTEKTQEKFEFIGCVQPREDLDPRKRDNINMPFASIVIDISSRKIVDEGGFEEFPYAVPRWETSSGEVYGRSPGMIALPDSRTLQAMGKTLLRGGQMAVDPPTWALDDAVIGVARMFPGGVTYIDGEAARDAGTAPFGVFETGKNIPLGREMQNDVRQQIGAAFLRNVLQLPVDSPRMTATEVLERKSDFIRAIGTVFGQLEADYIGHIAERVYNIMLRAGQFLPPPDVLQGQPLKFRFQSPVQRARKQTEAAGLARSLETYAPLLQNDPTMLDRLDGDRIMSDAPDVFGYPEIWNKTDEQVDEARQQRAQQQAAQQALEQVDQGAGAAEKLAGAAQKAGLTEETPGEAA